MCFIAEIAMMIFGIITLVRGKFNLMRNRIVTGAPAYAIGIILTATLPLIMGIGFVIGVVLTINAHGQKPDVQQLYMLSILDVVLVPFVLLVVIIIALAAPKNSKDKQDIPD